ncbi:MAG TPA: cadherin repeat domain-containing protein [Spirochaetia bacterium]
MRLRQVLFVAAALLSTGAPAGATTLFGGGGSVLSRVDAQGNVTDVSTSLSQSVVAMTYDPADGFLYASPAALQRTLFRIDPATGAVTVVSASPDHYDFTVLCYDGGNGLLYGFNNGGGSNGVYWGDHFLVIDPATGEAQLVNGGTLRNCISMAYDSASGVLYGINADGNVLYRIDPATGGMVDVNTSPLSRTARTIAYDPTTDTLFATDAGLNGSTGTWVSTGADPVFFRIDPSTGAITDIDTSMTRSIQALAGTPLAVPEPGALALALLALGATLASPPSHRARG